MDTIILERKERILMFFNEYYFGVSALVTIFRMFGGPIIFYVGLIIYSSASDRFGIGYGGMMIAFSIYYALKPLWWILIKWKYHKTVKFQLEAAPDKLIIKEDRSESQIDYSKFESIVQRKHYFSLRVQNGLKMYLPIKRLSERTVKTLAEKEKK